MHVIVCAQSGLLKSAEVAAEIAAVVELYTGVKNDILTLYYQHLLRLRLRVILLMQRGERRQSRGASCDASIVSTVRLLMLCNCVHTSDYCSSRSSVIRPSFYTERDLWLWLWLWRNIQAVSSAGIYT